MIKAFLLVTPLLIAVIYFTRFNLQVQFKVFVIAAASYVFLALLHHLKEKTLTWEIMIEYLLIAGLSLIVIQNLLL